MTTSDVFIFPTSFAQQHLWLLDQLEPGNPAYNIAAAVRLDGELNIAALEQTMQELARRHEALHTTFRASDGLPVQVLSPPSHLPLPLVSLETLPAASRHAAVQQILAAESQHRFDLARGPLMRVRLVRLAEQEHLLALVLHHIIADGWSLGVLVRELGALYGAFSRGEASPLAELPVQYADYAVWQRERLEGGALGRQLDYWRGQLQGAPPVLELPADRARPAERSFRGGAERVELGAGLSGGLRGLARREGATPFMVLLAAFKALLTRYTGQTDLVVGSPVAGRLRPEMEGLVGLFVNSLVLRSVLPGDVSFLEAVKRVREVCLDAYAHQEVPFEKLVEELRPERSLSHAPLFQVYFNMLNMPDIKIELSGLTVTLLALPEVNSKFDLTLYAREERDRICLELVYNSELFEQVRMRETLEQFEHLLEQVAVQPEKEISAFSLITPRAKALLPDPTERLSDQWEGAVHTLFARQARRVPDRPAVVDEQECWTYRELDARSNQLANYLVARGIRPQDVVVVYGHRSASLVLALLSISKAGAAFVVLDPGYPTPRLIDCLSVARPRAWLQLEAAGSPPQALESFLDSSSCRGCRLALPARKSAVGQGPLASYSCDDPGVAVGPDDTAYVAFTSGTTGKPKGVMGRHGSLTHFLPWLRETFGLGEADRFSMLSGLSHDPLHRDIFTPLQLGAAVCIPDPECLNAPETLVEWMKRAEISITHLTPAMGQLLSGTTSITSHTKLTSLRYAFFVGDVLTRLDVQRLRDLAPSVTCVNYYGSTETQRAVGHFIVADEKGTHRNNGWEESAGKRVVPLGRGIRDVQLLILNSAHQLAGFGEAGEIFVRSPHIAKGYLNDEQLTQEKFIVNPFTGERGDRLYKAGDIGRYMLDGNVEPLGRADNQVKLRGFRIELGEVESVLAAHPLVGDCVVVSRGVGVEQRLVAYVVGRAGAAPGAAELRRHLGERLPAYMVPSAFVSLDSLPLTPNGKLDRRALPDPGRGAAGGGGGPAAARTAAEELVAGVWAEVLGAAEVGVEEDFFALGGHSLLATQVVARVREACGVEVGLRELFARPTVRGLAARVEQGLRGGAAAAGVGIGRAGAAAGGAAPLSFAQQRLWFLMQLEPDNVAYNVAGALRLAGQLDVRVLERAFNEVIRRHEALRTRFDVVAGEPVQVIDPQLEVAIEVVSLEGLPEQERETEAARLVAQEAEGAFDLREGPLLRVRLVRLAEQEHLLALVLHHIIADGWSLGVLVRELGALYGAFSRGEASPLAELPVQYADYAVWQRERLEGGALGRQLDYWRGQLQGAPPVLELPADRARPAERSFRGGAERVELGAGLSGGLRGLARREGATPFMVLLAAFKALLTRYTGQTDLVVGSPVAGRRHTQVEGLIGFFANTLVLRTRFRSEDSFRQLLRHVRDVTLEADAHQEVPFEKLVEELQPERSLSHSPLFQVMFAWQQQSPEPIDLPSLRVSALAGEGGTAKFDLTLSMTDDGHKLAGLLEYSTDLFETATARRLLKHFETLLHGIVADPETPLIELPLLTPEERHQQLVRLNDTGAGYPREEYVHQLFEAQAARTPDAVAVEFESERLTYRELNGRADRLAAYLRALGVRSETLVGLCVERSIKMLVGLLGILKAGAAYVPLDPAYPPQRLSLILEDARVAVLLTQQSLLDVLPAQTARVVCLDSDCEAITATHTRNPASEARGAGQADTLSPAAGEHPADAGCLAYVIFTSGSTGRPKGVQVSHRALVNFLAAMRRRLGLSPGDSLLAITTLSFDIAALELFLPLSIGGRVVLASREVAVDAVRLYKRLEQQPAITVMQATPATWQMLLNVGWNGSANLKVLCGGEAMSRELGRQLFESSAKAWNLYGPTESTVWATCHELSAESVRRAGETVAIGQPIANTQVYVLDARMQVVPIGVVGELYLGGDGLARNYLRRPGLTAERFIPDPFSAAPGARLYRTGDLARYLPEGEIEFLGRADNQVKLRGFRIELGEVESVLAAHPLVGDCVVVSRGVGVEQRLVAYVVGRAGAAPGAAELRRHLGERLPAYMVPSAFVSLDSLPLTPNGKLDRRALPDPGRGAAGGGGGPAAARTAAEELVAGVWAEVLGAAEVGVEEDFFALGGHSLLATQVVARVREACGVEVGLRELFARPTVRGLAARVEQGLRGGAAATGVGIGRAGAAAGGAAPLSFAQQRLWFLMQLEPGSAAYNMPVSVHLRGALNVAALEGALSVLVRRHESLRTTFAADGGRPAQVINAPYTVSLPVQDLSALAASVREAETSRIAKEEARRPFDLKRGPLLRAGLVRLSEEEHVVTFTTHHIVSDAWSMRVLVHEVAALYESLATGRLPSLPELKIQYADYTRWQRELLQGEVLEKQLGYWRRQLNGMPALLELPTDYPRPAVQGSRGATHHLTLPAELSDQLRALSRRERVTLFMTLLTAWQGLLARYSGQEDIAVGSPIANRSMVEAEPLIGFFANTLVLRSDLSGDPGFSHLLKLVKEMCLGAYAHQEVPFEKLVEELQPERSLSHSPLFQVMFTLQNEWAEVHEVLGLTLSPKETDNETVKFDLMLSMREAGGEIVGQLKYNTDLFEEATIRRMADHFERLLAGVVADPGQRLSRLPLLTEQERRQLLVDFSGRAADYPRGVRGTRAYVLDSHMGLVPVGVCGELYLGGVELAQWEDERGGLTAERFVPHPYSEAGGERLYKTGDMVRWGAGGELEYLGRVDEQVKLRGFRIELGEVEAVLRQHAAVREAVVVSRGVGVEQRLVAYVVGRAGAAPGAAELRRHLGEHLPAYMMPAKIVELGELPLTPDGEVDKQSLPEPGEEGGAASGYVAPRTALEEVIAGLWAEALGVAEVGAHDNFFELGGHSLLATQLLSRIREAFGVEVALRELFEHPTLGELALAVDEAVLRGAGVSAPPIVPVSREGALPVSFAQQRLWFLMQLEPNSSFYNSPVALRLKGHLDFVALRQTLDEVVRRHEALRTTFAAVGGQPVQVICPPTPVPLPLVDLSGLGEGFGRAECERLAAEEARRPFDLSKGPLLRATLLRLEADEHVVLFTMHHINSDAWSVRVLVSEVAALYGAYLEGRLSPLPELKVQYADYAAWQREWLQGEELERQVVYWREHLAGAPPVLELPTDRPRPAVQSHCGARYDFRLSAELTRQLHELSRREGVTLFMTLLAGWQLLLAHYSGQEDIVVGTPIANRHRAEVEPLIGFFVNMLVLRSRLDPSQSFRELLARAREACLGAYAHQDVPFEKLVEELQPERSLGHSPLFQVAFGLEQPGGAGLRLPGLELSEAGVQRGEVIFDLSLSMLETDGELAAHLEYDSGLFDGWRVERMAGHYLQLLREAVSEPGRRVSEMEMLTSPELEQLEEWNSTARDYERRGLVHEQLARRAAEHASEVALTTAQITLTYAELDASADRLARLLIERGVTPGGRVGVLLERSAESVVSMLAIWKAGGVYLPLDLTHPAARLSFVLGDARPEVVVVRGGLPEGVEAGSARFIDLESERELLAAQPAGAVGVSVDEGQVAYVIYTSGSTGEPKGVEVEHRQLLNTLCGAQELFGFTEADVVPCLAPLTFDISLFELLCPLLAGARVLLVDSRRALEAAELEALFAQVTVCHAVPALMRRILEVVGGPDGDGGRGDYSQVRALLVGGDAVAPELLQRMRQTFPQSEVSILYGPTETAIICATCRVEEGEEVTHQLAGRPMGNVSLRLLDAAGREVPVGIVGEIHIGGAGVARGYLNREELTRERFITLEGVRYYRSGDLGRWLANGIIEFVGRVDEQVKVRGYRVETGEVESALASHAAVKQAVVVARGDGSGEKRLVAYYLAAEGAEAPAAGELRAHLQRRLPDYMVPSVFVPLDEMPLTANAKVDQKRLPAPEAAGVTGEAEYVAPRTATEEMLTGLWRELLGVERVGVTDNFFELGGHSLLATQTVFRLREVCGVELPLRHLLEEPTVAALAARVEAAAGESAGPPLRRAARTGSPPLSFAQQRLWFLDQLEPGSASYNVPTAVRLRGELDVSALRRALNEVVRRHESLRTSFGFEGGRAVQVIAPESKIEVPLVCLSSLDETRREAEAQLLIAAESARPFELTGGSLLRVTLLRLSGQEHVLVLVMHHIVSDGWSVGVLVRELTSLYRAFGRGEESPLQELPIQYADYAAWQREWLQGEVLERQLAYWRGKLAHLPALELPARGVQPRAGRGRSGRVPVACGPELTDALKRLSRGEGATLLMTLLAALSTLLYRHTGQSDIVIGTGAANRSRSETEGLIGFFVNMLPLRTDLAGNPTFRQLLGRVRRAALEAYLHQDVPFEKIVEEVQPERAAEHTPVFRVVMVLNDIRIPAIELPGLSVSGMAVEGGEPHFDLTLSLAETGRGLEGVFEYDSDLFEAATVERLAEHYRELLESVASDAEQCLLDIKLMRGVGEAVGSGTAPDALTSLELDQFTFEVS